MAVGRLAPARQLRIDRRAARLRRFRRFEQERRRAARADKAVAVAVKRPRRARRIGIARERPHAVKGINRFPRKILAADDQHPPQAPQRNLVEGVAQRLRRRSTRGHESRDGPADAVVGREIEVQRPRDRAHDRHRRDAFAARVVDLVEIMPHQPRGAGGAAKKSRVFPFQFIGRQPGVGDDLFDGEKRVQPVWGQPAQNILRHGLPGRPAPARPERRRRVETFDRARDLHRQIGAGHELEFFDARGLRSQTLTDRRPVVADAGDEAYARNDDPRRLHETALRPPAPNPKRGACGSVRAARRGL